MSVNAVNGVEPQKKSNPIGTAIGAGLLTGGIGAGAGYLWGGAAERPTLKGVLQKDTVDFKSIEEKASDEQKTALNEIKSARESVTTRAGLTEELKNQKVKIGENEISYNEASADANNKLKAYQKAKGELAVAADADKAAKQTAMEEAKAELDKARETRKTVFNEVKKDKITKLAEVESNKTAFEKVQKLFKKEIKWGKIGMWGGIAAAAGLILGFMLGNKKPAEAPQETQA